MIHWAGSYSLIGLVAWLSALNGWTGAWSGAASLIAGLFAALTLLALLTHAFGRGRNGLYSAERAVMLTLFSALFVGGVGFWVGQDWSAAEAGRALDQSVALAVQALL